MQLGRSVMPLKEITVKKTEEGQSPPTVMVAFSDNEPILHSQRFRVFWVDADPMSGLIRVGRGAIFGHDVLITCPAELL